MSAINACLRTLVTNKNNIASFSYTGIQHELTDRIIYLLEASSNESIIPCRYHPKTSFPLYTDSILDCCSGLGLSSGLPNHWRAYERQQSGSSASGEKSTAVLFTEEVEIKRIHKTAETRPFSSSASSGLGTRLDNRCLR